jgi:hypothetical protein
LLFAIAATPFLVPRTDDLPPPSRQRRNRYVTRTSHHKRRVKFFNVDKLSALKRLARLPFRPVADNQWPSHRQQFQQNLAAPRPARPVPGVGIYIDGLHWPTRRCIEAKCRNVGRHHSDLRRGADHGNPSEPNDVPQNQLFDSNRKTTAIVLLTGSRRLGLDGPV